LDGDGWRREAETDAREVAAGPQDRREAAAALGALTGA
jgi:hypothetical protein